jgi:hypothetical protein
MTRPTQIVAAPRQLTRRQRNPGGAVKKIRHAGARTGAWSRFFAIKIFIV